MKMQKLLDRIAEESGIKALSEAVSQLLDRAHNSVWKDVITTSEAVRILLATGTSRNSPIIRTAIKWLLGQQDKSTGSWNNEVWDTTAVLRALKADGFDLNSAQVKKGIRALRDQYSQDNLCWWDIWETSMAIQCLVALDLEDDMVHNATQWLLDKRYPSPHNNWLNIHTTASVLETLSNTEFQWDNKVLEAKVWLEHEVKKQEADLDIWSLALATRALNYYSRSEDEGFLKKLIYDRLVPAINQGNLDAVDLCQVSSTLIQCVPTIMRSSTMKAMVDLAKKDQKGLADLFINIACAWTVGGMVREREEKAFKPYVVTFGLTKRQLLIMGLIGSLASIIGILLWLLGLLG